MSSVSSRKIETKEWNRGMVEKCTRWNCFARENLFTQSRNLETTFYLKVISNRINPLRKSINRVHLISLFGVYFFENPYSPFLHNNPIFKMEFKEEPFLQSGETNCSMTSMDICSKQKIQTRMLYNYYGQH